MDSEPVFSAAGILVDEKNKLTAKHDKNRGLTNFKVLDQAFFFFFIGSVFRIFNVVKRKLIMALCFVLSVCLSNALVSCVIL